MKLNAEDILPLDYLEATYYHRSSSLRIFRAPESDQEEEPE